MAADARDARVRSSADLLNHLAATVAPDPTRINLVAPCAGIREVPGRAAPSTRIPCPSPAAGREGRTFLYLLAGSCQSRVPPTRGRWGPAGKRRAAIPHSAFRTPN